MNRERRGLHPGAWWLWALGLAATATRTTNPLLLLLVIAVAGYVVAARRSDAPWAGSYGTFLRAGFVVLVIRELVAVLFGARTPGFVLVDLPSVPLPGWAAGVSLGGPVTAELVVGAFYDGLRLAVVFACFGAVNALASPYRMLRSLPAALYEAGVAVTVALSFAPQATATVHEVRAARRLRGRPTHGPRALRGLAVPVLEGALERSLSLAASMDSRGYGRVRPLSAATRRVSGLATAAGMVLVCVGMYGVLDQGSPGALRLPALAAGAALLAGGMFARGRRAARSRYRPDPWRTPEWLVVASGLLPRLVIGLAPTSLLGGMHPASSPVSMPPLPWLPALAILIGLLPAVVAPLPTRTMPVPAPSLPSDAVAA